MRYEVIYEAAFEVKRFYEHTSPLTPQRLICYSLRLFALWHETVSFWFTAVGGPQLIKADKPRSIIYAVILHEVYSALGW